MCRQGLLLRLQRCQQLLAGHRYHGCCLVLQRVRDSCCGWLQSLWRQRRLVLRCLCLLLQLLALAALLLRLLPLKLKGILSGLVFPSPNPLLPLPLPPLAMTLQALPTAAPLPIKRDHGLEARALQSVGGMLVRLSLSGRTRRKPRGHAACR